MCRDNRQIAGDDRSARCIIDWDILIGTRFRIPYDHILRAASSLSADEQQTLVEIIGRRLAEHNRAELLRDVRDARAELNEGNAQVASVVDIMGEVRRET